MENKLAVLDRTMPLRSYPKEKLQDAFENHFIFWISDLLGLTGEESAKRLLIALPAIEKHFWSLGFVEIKKAFTMYADSELKTKPLPNYFTRILVGQIFKEYNEQKPKKKIMEPEVKKLDEATNEKLFIDCLTDEFKEFKKLGKVNNLRNWLYDDLVKKGITVEDIPKNVAWKLAIKEVKEAQNFVDFRDRLNDADLKVQAITLYKQKLIEIIFRRYIEVEQLINSLK